MKNKILYQALIILGATAMNLQVASAQRSPHLTRVLEFMPAPGQFIHEVPEYETGNTAEDMRLMAETYLANNARSMVSLGGFGGYITVGFDHTIANVAGEYDFKVLGNAFYADANPNPDGRLGGSCEPGVIQVSYDANGNGLADDAWYEIAGSEYNHPQTVKNYELTYHRPDPDKQPVTDDAQPHYSDLEYIRWSDNQGNGGYLKKNVFHAQAYFPEWIEGDKYTLRGTRLPDNGVDESGSGNYFVLYAFDYGYADNHPNTSDLSNIKIDWAVNADGVPVWLPGVDFIRIHTGVHQQNGWLGECSTEILGVTDLHPSIEAALPRIERNDRFVFYPNPCSGILTVESEESQLVRLLDVNGVMLARYQLTPGKNQLDMTALPQGMYLLQSEGAIEKLWIRK